MPACILGEHWILRDEWNSGFYPTYNRSVFTDFSISEPKHHGSLPLILTKRKFHLKRSTFASSFIPMNL